MSKFPQRDRHNVVENTKTKDKGMTEKMVAPPAFQENVFSQDYENIENIRFYYPSIYLSYRNKCNPPLALP